MSAASVSDIGRYRLIVELARGGMGVVYLGVVRGPAKFSKLVVLKELKRELAEDPVFLDMFLDEARISARLSHPNVVQTNEVASFDDGSGIPRHFIVMEFLDGQPLHRVISRLTRAKKLTPQAYARVLVDVLAGLHHAHELADFDGAPLGIVHRDMSPHNVFVTYDGQIKIVDFGIAKAVDQVAETKSGTLKGKVAYMAPEQARGERVDLRADVFSVGAMLWEAAAGQRLWSGMSEVAVLATLTAEGVPSPRTHNPSLDPELERIVRKATQSNREHRYRTAAAMQADLERWLATQRDVPTPRAIGALVAEAFSTERRELRGVIETQLGSLADVSTGEIAAVALAKMSMPSMTPSLRTGADSTSGTPISQISRNGVARMTPTHGGASIIDARPPSNGRRWAYLIAAIALVSGVVVGQFAMRKPPAQNEPVRSIQGVPADPTSSSESFKGLPREVPEPAQSPSGVHSTSSSVAAETTNVAPTVSNKGKATVGAPRPPASGALSAGLPVASASPPIPAASAESGSATGGRPKRKIDTDDPYKVP